VSTHKEEVYKMKEEGEEVYGVENEEGGGRCRE
jgi:hypothetical protein